MLPKNYVVDKGLYNGAIGDLKSLHFEDKTGPLVNEPKGYAIVDFPACSVPENKSLVPGMPRTCIPVPIVMFCCEKMLCHGGFPSLGLQGDHWPQKSRNNGVTEIREQEMSKKNRCWYSLLLNGESVHSCDS